jgi:hypothetical protein
MPIGTKFARADGDVEFFNGTATPGQTTLAVQTTLVAATTTLTGGVNVVVPIAGSTAVALPQNAGGPIVVYNRAATAVALLVFPPWNAATGAAAGGVVNFGAANASLSIAQNGKAIFYPLANGVDYIAVVSA